MKAPEKIYLHPCDRAGEEYEYELGTMPWGEDYVEYTRTDAFIEKAANYLNYILYDRVEIKNPGKIIPSLCAKSEFIEDFKRYMKKE